MVKSKVKQLEEKFGGKWRYCGQKVWECLDDNRMVMAVSSCSCDYDCGSSSRYYLYGEEEGSQEVHFDYQELRLCRNINF